jgi:hypothetical protein
VKFHGASASLHPAFEAARTAERARRTPPPVFGPPPPPAAAEFAAVADGWRFDVDEHGALVAVHDATNTRVVIATPNPDGGAPR